MIIVTILVYRLIPRHFETKKVKKRKLQIKILQCQPAGKYIFKKYVCDLGFGFRKRRCTTVNDIDRLIMCQL